MLLHNIRPVLHGVQNDYKIESMPCISAVLDIEVTRCVWCFIYLAFLTALKKGSHDVLSQVSLHTPRFDNAQEGVHGVQKLNLLFWLSHALRFDSAQERVARCAWYLMPAF